MLSEAEAERSRSSYSVFVFPLPYFDLPVAFDSAQADKDVLCQLLIRKTVMLSSVYVLRQLVMFYGNSSC
jgi:hypothetical protein